MKGKAQAESQNQSGWCGSEWVLWSSLPTQGIPAQVKVILALFELAPVDGIPTQDPCPQCIVTNVNSHSHSAKVIWKDEINVLKIERYLDRKSVTLGGNLNPHILEDHFMSAVEQLYLY